MADAVADDIADAIACGAGQRAAWRLVGNRLLSRDCHDGTEWVPGPFRAELLPGESPLAALAHTPRSLILTTAGRLVCSNNAILGEARVFDPKHVALLRELTSHMLDAESCDEDFDIRVCERLLAKTIAALA